MTTQIMENIAALLAEKPMTSTALHAALPQAESMKQISNALHRLKTDGRARRNDAGEWEAVGAVATRPARKTKTPVARLPKDGKAVGKAPPMPAEKEEQENRAEFRRLLAENVQRAQDAIDAYVAMVGDPEILNPLVTARNKARAALAVFEAKGAT